MNGPPDTARRNQWVAWQSILCFLGGVVWPIVIFALVWEEPADAPRWQSGEISAYAKLMLGGNAAVPMYPLMLYAMVSMSVLLYSFERFVEKFWVRMGVYSGAWIASHYILVLWMAFVRFESDESIGWLVGSFVVCLILLAIFSFLSSLSRRFGAWKFGKMMAIGLVGVYLAIVILTCTPSGPTVFWWEFPFEIAFVLAVYVAAPQITWVAFVALVWRIVNDGKSVSFRFSLMQVFAVTSWFAAYLAMVRWSVTLALVEYTKLPTQRSNCYIATAASQGHPWFVGSYDIRCGDGTSRRVNEQLRHFKMAEIAMAVAMPRAHRGLRRIYDCIGPRAACFLRWPGLADVAYLLLKPAEYFATFLLGILAPEYKSIGIYNRD